MGILVAVEGLDGAGKRTLIGKVVDELGRSGRSVATLDFPRYGRSVPADLAAEALRGAHGDLAHSVNAMAVLFALDRAGACEQITELSASHDIVLLDRYVASNAAYNAARMRQGVDGEMVAWVRELELVRLAMPAPDLQIYLQVPVELAEQRARGREAQDASRDLDAYERDGDLQSRTGALYAELAATDWVSPWWLIGPETGAVELAQRLTEFG
ncbi:dTMP kinase [Rhodococcus sp. 27YEA15]|uniref:dTMP kinase n=1 Tax=Rhodococcus sp. 27YEA15 TaxID=3156259 RepID=UPI003C7E6478